MGRVTKYAWDELLLQFYSIAPLTAFLIVFYVSVKQAIVADVWETIAGMVAATVGLAMFLFGIKGGLLPMGERISTVLFERFSMPVVLSVSCLLGILVTLAEPAIASMRPLGQRVSSDSAPFLYYIMHEQVELLLLFIGLGVGAANVLSACRFLHDWPLRKMVMVTALLCVLLTGLVYLLVPDVRGVISLAWDVGAITTGPITVPIMLALGTGAAVMRRRDESSPAAAQRSLDGFGMVTLASLIPIVSVLFFTLIIFATVRKEDIAQPADGDESDSTTLEPPYREIIYGLRSFAPLCVFLIGFTHLALREQLPVVTVDDIICASTPSSASTNSRSRESKGTEAPQASATWGDYCRKRAVLAYALVSGQVGLILFNIGLYYGFSSLGSQVGELLPSMYAEVDTQPDSPFLPKGAGTAVTLSFVSCVGLLATAAEPGLKVLAEQVRRLTGGALKRRRTIYSVGTGVGIGMALGAVYLQLEVNIIAYLFPLYAIALILTIFADETFINVAWDSAGVTTGPVTVPFVIAMSLAYSKAQNSTTGFGVLACASVCPIIVVLSATMHSKTRPDVEGRDAETTDGNVELSSV